MKNNDKLNEECAVFGVSIRNKDAAGITYNGLLALQHRGQEGSGISVLNDNRIYCYKKTGSVNEVFTENILSEIPRSNTAIGHNRYSTTGSNTLNNVQPFVTEYLTGRIATCHNGNITNAKVIKEYLQSKGILFEATSDSEVISTLIAYHIVKTGDILKGVVNGCKLLEGAFNLIILCSNGNLIAVRDGNGCRPLCIGKNNEGYCVGSESCALDSCGFEFVRDVMPGEVIVFLNGEMLYSNIVLKGKEDCGLCIFEYVYFARPDSVIDNLSVYEARYNMGVALANEHPVNADVVCGVPDSGLEAAFGYSKASGIPLITGFVKNRYIGRSFIYPLQSQRESAVRLKLNPLSANIKNKSIVLIDDSIVRGTTSGRIVKSLKNAGAKEVHLRISSPPFRYTCNLGTDIDEEDKLIANTMSIDNIRESIGADSLGFISIEGLKNACAKCNLNFCTKCFTGNRNLLSKKDLE